MRDRIRQRASEARGPNRNFELGLARCTRCELEFMPTRIGSYVCSVPLRWNPSKPQDDRFSFAAGRTQRNIPRLAPSLPFSFSICFFHLSLKLDHLGYCSAYATSPAIGTPTKRQESTQGPITKLHARSLLCQKRTTASAKLGLHARPIIVMVCTARQRAPCERRAVDDAKTQRPGGPWHLPSAESSRYSQHQTEKIA